VDRIEAWDRIVTALEQEFLHGDNEPGEFKLHINNRAGSIIIVEQQTREALSLTDTTGTHYDAKDRIVFEKMDRSYRQAPQAENLPVKTLTPAQADRETTKHLKPWKGGDAK